MKRHVLLLAAGVIAALARPASAGVFFNRHPKPNATDQVPTLVGQLKADTDDRKRADAAERLREFDPATYPEIVPVLMDALQHDQKAGVRVEALQSLARIRPVSPEVGQALEQAAEHDSSLRVRLQARASLVQYRLAGFRGPKKEQASEPALPGVTNGEPPLADPAPPRPTYGPTASNRIRAVPQTAPAPRLMPAGRGPETAPPPELAPEPELSPPQ